MNCSKCKIEFRSHWLKDGVCRGCYSPDSIVTADIALNCSLEESCENPVTHLDNKGFVYCTTHGKARNASVLTRKLKPMELKLLKAGKVIFKY